MKRLLNIFKKKSHEEKAVKHARKLIKELNALGYTRPTPDKAHCINIWDYGSEYSIEELNSSFKIRFK